MTDRVAIVGASIRTAGARDGAELWRMLAAGRGGRREIGAAELERRGVPQELRENPSFVPVSYQLDNPAGFDTAAFAISPAEAELMDPQHRAMLVCGYRAVENAGHHVASLPDTVGVYVGARPGPHAMLLRQSGAPVDQTKLVTGSYSDYLAARLSYTFGLRGPAISVQTTCSTSAVAIHLATQAILAGECDSAVAGGVAIDIEDAGYLHAEGGVFSPRGRCEPFTTHADGTVDGNGAAAVFLRRLDLALAEGDPILAVIAGTAVNNDGRDRVGFTAPSVSGQADVIGEALDVAELNPGRIGLFETHGTGTAVGDPLEIEAAARAYREAGMTGRDLRLGTLKANVGHLTAAAGAAGVIASLLAMRNEAIAPNLPLVEGAEAIDMSGSPFRLDDRVRTWKRGAEPRYAAISSFGLGGTNAHIIIGDPHETAQRGARRSWQVLPLSADDPERMSVTVAAYREAVTNATPDERHDLAHTLRMGRPELPVRTVAVVPAADTAGDSTATVAWPAAESFRTPAGQPSLIYLLPGQGGPATQAAHRLYDTEPWFAATVDEGLAIVESVTDPATVTRVREAFTTGSSTADTRIAQPVGHLTACGVATILNRLSAVRPAAIAGHSVAEITAAHLAGVMSFADATAAVCYRGAAMAAMPPGEMYAVRAEAASLTGMPAGAEVSVRNAPSASVISTMDGEALREWLAARGVEYRRLETSHAFHHTSMEPAAGQFAKWMGDMELRPPQIAVLSCPDGDWLDARRATDPLYWGRQSREPVDFVAGTARLVAEYPSAVYVQLSGGTHLLGAVREAGSATGAAAAGLAVLPGGDARMTLPAAIGGLWQHGIAIDWNAYTRGDRGKRTITPPRPLRDTPVLHPSLRGHTPGIDPADLDIPHPAPPAPAADDEETPLLDAVSQCWAETLGATPEADADFFASGGDSIAAAQIVAGLRSRFNVPIPVHLPLVVTSPRELAKAVDDLLIAAVLNN